jgi:hypothetical protein
MRVSKKITNSVEKSSSEFSNALRNATFSLLAILGEQGEFIKLEKPLSLVSSKLNGDKSESVVNVAVAKYISYIAPYEGKPESGYYLLYSEPGDSIDNLVSLDIKMTPDNRLKVYEALKAMVRHKA